MYIDEDYWPSNFDRKWLLVLAQNLLTLQNFAFEIILPGAQQNVFQLSVKSI